MVKFRVTETSNGNFQNAEGDLPFDIAGLGPEGATVSVKIWNTSTGSATVIPPYNEDPPSIIGAAGSELSLAVGGWNGATSFNYYWFVDGAPVATTLTYTPGLGAEGKTVTAAVEGLIGAVSGGTVAASNLVFIPVGVEAVVENGEWETYEAPEDINTGKMYARVNDTPTSLYQFAFYRGTNPDGDLSALGAMVAVDDYYEATSSGRAAIGTPSARSIQYIRIAERPISDPAGVKRWVSETKSYFASSVPAAPVVALSTGSGQGQINIDITDAADGSGRAVTSYEYQLNGGAWTNLPGGLETGVRVIGGLTPVTQYSVSVRAMNANGAGIATAAALVTAGTAATAPSAFTAWDVVDKPSAAGNVLTISFAALPSDGGSSITGVFYTVNGGSAVSLGTTPTSVDITGITPAETATVVVIYASNAIGAGAQDSKTKTPTRIASASNTAYFGALTETGDGGWKPETSAGDEVDLTGIVSQTGMTRTWSITTGSADAQQNGSLVCTGGTPLVDDGKTLTVSTAAGNIVVTISCVADAWSVSDGGQLGRILSRAAVVPRSVMLRPRLYDLGRGFASSNPTGNGVFQSRTYTATSRRTVTTHPGQIKRPWSVDTSSRMYDAQHITIENFDFTCATTGFGRGAFFLQCGKGSGTGNRAVYFNNCKFLSPDIPAEARMDLTAWPGGYTGPIASGIMFQLDSGLAWDTRVTNCLFKNVYYAGSFTVRGNFMFTDNTVDTWYDDCVRLAGYVAGAWTGTVPDNGEPKVIARNKYINPLGRTNEVSVQAPHVDSQQLIKGDIYNCLWWQNMATPGVTRADKLAFYQTNGGLYRCTIGGEIGLHKGDSMPWGINPANGGYLVFANVTLIHTTLAGSAIRVSASGNAYGEVLFQNVWCATTASSSDSLQVSGANFATIDPARIVKINTIDTKGISIPANFEWTGDMSTFETSLASVTPKAGGLAATNGVGALDTAGAYRTDEWPPMHGEKPTLANSGADVIITPSVSKLAYVTPASWEYVTRNPAVSVNWNAAVTGLTGPTATLTAPNKTGLEVMCRWVGTNGLKGTWSEIQTVIV